MASVAATSQPPISPMSSPQTSTTCSADAAEVSKCFIVNKSLRTHNTKPIAVTLKTIDEKWSFNKAHQSVMNSLEQDLASKPRSPRPNRPTVNTNSDIVAQLTQLKIMKTEGDITEEEFLAAKYSLFKQ